MLTISSILKESFRFNLVTISQKIVSIPVTLFIANYLGPETYGFVGYLMIWYSYGILISLGTIGVPFREIPLAKSQKEVENVIKDQNTAMSIDIVFNIAIALLVFILGITMHNINYSLPFFIISVALIVVPLQSFYEGMLLARKKFKLVASSRLISGMSIILFSILTVFLIREYSLLIAPIFGALISLLYLIKKYSIYYKFEVNIERAKRMLKIGPQLQLLSIVFKFSKMIDTTIIGSFYNLYHIGIYTFVSSNITKLNEFFSDFGRVLQPMVYSESIKSDKIFFDSIAKITVQIGFIAAIITNFSQLFFFLIIKEFVIKYSDSIDLFFILSLKLFFTTLALPPNVILSSSHVNKQNQSSKSYLVSILLTASLGMGAYILNYGIIGITIVVVISTFIFVFRQYFLSWKYFLSDKSELVAFIIHILFISAVLFINTVIYFLIKNFNYSFLLMIIINLFTWGFVVAYSLFNSNVIGELIFEWYYKIIYNAKNR